jgi:hypothetical protein
MGEGIVMDADEAAGRLAEVQRVNRRSAAFGAWVTVAVVSVAVLAMGVVNDLEMVWLSGLIVLGVVGLWMVRPLRSRVDWSDRAGAWLVGGGGVLAVVAYVGVQIPVRAAGWEAPNTLGAVAAVVVILVLCRAGLERVVSAGPTAPRA